MPYTYTKLATPTTIRLIQVMPEKVDDTIACIIHTYDTEQLQEDSLDKSYRALSYRWGNPDATRSVYLKDPAESKWHLHPVHENLWRFVECVWQQHLFQDHFWTDYFCLDQCSDEEKRQQIPRMSVIYAEATDVIIWLGLSAIEEQHIQCYLNWGKDEEGRVEVPRDETSKQIIDTVKALWYNEYWARVWIVQEVTLAKSAIILTRSFSITLSGLWGTVSKARPYWEWKYPSPFFNDLKDLSMIIDARYLKLWALLRDYVASGYQCKEPNDRLYGFLGLLDSPNDFIVIDYNRPYGHVILDAVLEAAADCPPISIREILDNFAMGQWPLGLTTNANELEEYLHDERTLPRHKDLAALVLIAFDAMSLVMTTSGAPQRCRGMSDTHGAISPQSGRVRGIQSEAIFMGITLAYGSTKPWASKLLQHWKTCRYHRLQKQSWRSPWVCKAHWHPTEDYMQEYIRRCDNRPSMEEYMQEFLGQYITRFHDNPSRYIYMKEYQRVLKRWHNENLSPEQYMRLQSRWHNETHYDLDVRLIAPETIVTSAETGGSFGAGMEEACRHAGEHCDGSSMVFEIPHAFFRMTVSRRGPRLEFFDKDAWALQ